MRGKTQEVPDTDKCGTTLWETVFQLKIFFHLSLEVFENLYARCMGKGPFFPLSSDFTQGELFWKTYAQPTW